VTSELRSRGRVTGSDLVLAGTLGMLAVGLGLEAVSHSLTLNPFLPVMVLGTLLEACLGAAVARRRPGHPVGRVLQLTAVAGAVVVAASGHADAALFGPLPQAGATVTLWVSRWLWVLLVAGQSVALLFAFPDGRLPSRRWRPLLWAAAAGVALLVLQAMGQPFAESGWRDVPVENPLGGQMAEFSAGLGSAPQYAFVLASAAGSAALVARRRRAQGDLRQRLRWVVPAALLMPPALWFSFLGPWWWGGVFEMAAGTLLAVSVTVATVRHRMYDADVALNRGLVYGLLVLSLVGAYVAVVVLVSELVAQSSWAPGVAGAAVVAVAFGPLLHRLRRGVDQAFFGARGRPGELASRLVSASSPPSETADTADELTLQRAAATLAQSLRLPWVRIETGERVVSWGEPRTEGHPIPLRRGDRVVGLLVVGRRFDGERVRTTEPALAMGVAQLALTVAALQTASDLRQARDRLVVAREEERRRIHRDLHDGLGPTLAGVSLGLEGAEQLARTDPAAAVHVLPALRAHAQEAVSDVRRLVDGLRPVELDDLGLVAALRARIDQLSTSGTPTIRVHADDRLPALPATTELAALRICLEAVTNSVRHACGTRCDVRVSVDPPWLVVEVGDDGCGIGAAVPHVGLRSMRERAEETGGRLDVRSEDGRGTCVVATLPLVGSQ
jgi:two-component system, NarL family, sensor kinase